jgi:hypothetical protein
MLSGLPETGRRRGRRVRSRRLGVIALLDAHRSTRLKSSDDSADNPIITTSFALLLKVPTCG